MVFLLPMQLFICVPAFDRGSTSWLMSAKTRPVGFLPETCPECASRPAGKRPGAFPRPPFAAPVRKISAYIAFYITAACVQRPQKSLRQPLHSRPYCSGALGFLPPRRPAGSGKASLAPCALAGDPLALSACGRRRCVVVTTGSARRRLQLFPVSVRVRSCPFLLRFILLSIARGRISVSACHAGPAAVRQPPAGPRLKLLTRVWRTSACRRRP